MLNRTRFNKLLFKEKNEYVVLNCNLKTNHICIYSYYHNKEKKKMQNIKDDKKARLRMERLKVNGCSICGYDKCNRALEFHHINPKDKKFNLNIPSLKHPNKIVVEEVNKCILLCCRCHREIHGKELYNGNK